MATGHNPQKNKGDRGTLAPTYKKLKSSDQTIGSVSNDEKAVLGLLDAMSVTSFEPKVVNLLIDYLRSYTVGVLEDAQDYAHHAGRRRIDVSDARLAVQLKQMSGSFTLPDQQVMLEVASEVNERPLPPIPEAYGVRLPESGTLLTPNYQISAAAQSKDELQPKRQGDEDQKNANGPKKQIEDTKIKIKLGGSGMSNESMQLQDGDENPNKRKWEEEHRVIGENSTKNASS